MPSKSKKENAAALLRAGIARKSFSIPEFCARNGISMGFYSKLRKQGKGAKETRVGDRILVTDAHEEEWLRERAAESAAAVDA